MEDKIEDDSPVVYAAWHIPCYAHHNCPDDLREPSRTSTTNTQLAGFASFFDWNLQNRYDWLAFLFLGTVICVSFIGICMLVGTLFVRQCKLNRMYLRRPLSHFLLILLFADILMTLIVIPVHTYDLLGGDTKYAILRPGTCLFRICTHFLGITTKSWCFVAYILLYHIHDGLIPFQRSVIVGIWVLIVSMLISIPGVVFGADRYIDTTTCTLVSDSSNWAMVLYISIIPFILPSCILTPILLKWSNLSIKLGVSPTISSDYLEQYDEQEDNENQEMASKYYETTHKHHPTILGDTESGAVPVIFIEHLEEDEVSSERSSLASSPTSSLNNINVQFKNDILKSNSLIVPMPYNRASSFSRASKGTLNFLSQDKNFSRILLILSIVHIVLWAPFFVNLILSSQFTLCRPNEDGNFNDTCVNVYEAVSLCILWLGYIETAITPILVYLLSRFVHKIINQICIDICPCNNNDRRNSTVPTKQIVKVTK